MCAFLLGIYYNYPSLFSLVNCIQLNDEAEAGWGEYMIDDEYMPYHEWLKTTPFAEQDYEIMMIGIELTDEIESSLIELIQSYYDSEDRTTDIL